MDFFHMIWRIVFAICPHIEIVVIFTWILFFFYCKTIILSFQTRRDRSYYFYFLFIFFFFVICFLVSSMTSCYVVIYIWHVVWLWAMKDVFRWLYHHCFHEQTNLFLDDQWPLPVSFVSTIYLYIFINHISLMRLWFCFRHSVCVQSF